MSKSDKLEQLRQLPVEAIRGYRERKSSDIIPPALQRYILQLDTVARLAHINDFSMTSAITQLQREFPELSPAAARGIYYDALDYFYFDDRLSAATWDTVYAEEMEALKKLAIAANKLEVAHKCIDKAHEYRTTKRESTEVDWRPPVFIINIAVKPEDLGYKSQKLMDIARRNEDQQFIQMIGSLPIPDTDKDRLLADAGIFKSTEEPDEQ